MAWKMQISAGVLFMVSDKGLSVELEEDDCVRVAAIDSEGKYLGAVRMTPRRIAASKGGETPTVVELR